MLERAPHTKDALVDTKGRGAIGTEFAHPVFNFAKPLSDPVGGTSKNQGRHHVKMEEPDPPPDAPEYILYTITGPATDYGFLPPALRPSTTFILSRTD